jgi:hypothetical protein
VWDWDFQAGLIGSPARSVAMEEMEKLLGEPDFPVTDRFLDTMSVLALPEEEVDDLPAQREKAEAPFRQQLISVVSQKRGAALAVSSNSIIEDAAIYSRAKVATRYQDFPAVRKTDAYEFNNASGAALTHWYEVAPDQAWPMVIHEILRPKPRFNASVLGVLPGKELPQADQMLLEHLNSQKDFDVGSNIASLIHRYASRAIEPQVTSVLDPSIGQFV